jgi:hypothetical protein
MLSPQTRRMTTCPDPIAYRWLLEFLFGDDDDLRPPDDPTPSPATPPPAAPTPPTPPPTRRTHSITQRRRRAAAGKTCVTEALPCTDVTQATDGKGRTQS